MQPENIAGLALYFREHVPQLCVHALDPGMCRQQFIGLLVVARAEIGFAQVHGGGMITRRKFKHVLQAVNGPVVTARGDVDIGFRQ